MRYRELLKLYEKKALSEQEMKQVAWDIERQDAISEYLFERDGELPFEENETYSENAGEKGTQKGLGTADADAGKKAGKSAGEDLQCEKDVSAKALEFTREVNRLIRRAFIKMGVSVGCVVLAIVLFVMFALPKVVSLFYYDPTELAAENTPVFCRDLRVYTELTMPGYIRQDVTMQERGYGEYDFTIYQGVSYNRKMTNIAGKIEKGKLQLYDINLLKRPTGNVFAWFQMTGDGTSSIRELTEDGARIFSAAGDREMATETLEGLSSTTTYLAYITLDKMMPYEEFMKFVEESGYPISWCAVATNSSDTVDGGSYFRAENLGFQCVPDRSNMLNWDQEKYPHLILWDEGTYGTAEWDELEKYMKQEAYMKEHFTSMLRYLADQKEFLAMMEGNDGTRQREQYQKAADYVEENGLMIYGCVAITDQETMLKMNEEPEVYEIYAEELR